MNEKELKELRKALKTQQKEVSNSKKAAQKLLTELGILTPRGNLRKAFKPA